MIAVTFRNRTGGHFQMRITKAGVVTTLKPGERLSVSLDDLTPDWKSRIEGTKNIEWSVDDGFSKPVKQLTGRN